MSVRVHYSSGSDSEGEPFFYLCFGAVLGAILFFRGFQLRKKKKLIEDIPTSTIRGMAMGLVEVKGAAREFKGLLKTPFSKQDCVFYRYVIQEYRRSGKNSRWVTIKEFSTPDWFYLEDETGKVLVNPVGAELFLAGDRQYRMGDFTSGENAHAFEAGLMEVGINPHGFFDSHKQLRCTETYVLPDDAIYIMGEATKNPLVESSAIGSENACIQKERAPFFCISDQSEKELLSSVSGKMYLFLYGGPVLTVVCLFILIGHYFKNMF